MNSQSKILWHLSQREKNCGLPQALYVSDDAFEADLENLFYREWLFVAHECELMEPGDFLRYQIGSNDVVIMRHQDNSINAFHNTCRHRGSRLCHEQKGQRSQLVCPYHQWTYDLAGNLRYAKEMGDDFVLNDHHLLKVHCRLMAGSIYICLAEIAPDFGEFKALVEPYIAPHNLQNSKVVHESNIIEEGNWKLVIENNRECYHCAASHPELCRTYSDNPNITGVAENPGEELHEIEAHWKKCQELELPCEFHLSANGQYRVSRVPLHNGAESFTLNGKVASQRLLVDVGEKALGTLLFFHYPNTWNHFLSDHAVTFRVTPLSADRTMVTTKWLVHKDAVEGEDYELENLTAVWTATNQQDLQLVEENHRGITSNSYRPGPYSPVHEAGVIQFVDWYQSFTEHTASHFGELESTDPLNLMYSNTWPDAKSDVAVQATTSANELLDMASKSATAVKRASVRAVDPVDSRLNNVKLDQNKIPFLYLDQSQPWEDQSAMLTVINIVPETHNVTTYSFRTESNNWFNFAPGQFITLELPLADKPIYRTYTISSSPSRPLSLSITVKVNEQSVGSQWMLDHLTIGMSLRAFGPAGDFNLYRHGADKYCFISAGSGITPMLSMTKYLFDRGGNIDVSFLHCARSPSQIIAKDEIERLSARVPSIKTAWVVSERDAFSPWSGYTGRMNQLILELTTPDYFDREIFCCGPESFMQTVRDVLNAAAFNMDHYHEESFNIPNLESNEIDVQDIILDEAIETKVSFQTSGQQMTSNQATTVLDTSLQAGLNIPSACQFGVCGTCKVKLVSGEVHMVHNGGISDREIEDGFILACCSNPLTDIDLEY